ncbi:Alpha/beta hydrolase [Candidatus Bandiella woodruffii]|uniref:Alpha/beta hydrolase n=2 Tax=Candidatus Bandiella euplotis TaxID=1664265 RepID=A0ABZ0ULY1_9RICK|nr:Alpha/beta hydrolase [Candidatus Bandiella woodruffii]
MLEYTKYIRNSKEPPKQLVVMLHGYGSNKNDLITLAPELSEYAPSALFISPGAPFQMEGYMREDCRQWFSLNDRSKEALLKEMATVEKIILNFISEQLKEHDLNEDNLCLLGFSQGTMLSLYLVLEGLIKPKIVLGYSGRTMQNNWKCQGNPKSTKIMLIHGKEDAIIPIEDMKTTDQILQKHGFQTQTHSIRYLAHGIDKDGINFGGIFLRDNFLTLEV